MAKIVETEVDFVALLCCPRRDAYYASVEQENVELFLFRYKFGGALPNTLKRCKVQLKKAHLCPLRNCVASVHFVGSSKGLIVDLVDDSLLGRFVSRQVGDVNAGGLAVSCEFNSRLTAKVSSGSYNEDDFASQRRNITRSLKDGAAFVTRPEQGDAGHLPEFDHNAEEDEDYETDNKSPRCNIVRHV